jgi:predicted O-methyltransferase YrrM
MKNYKEISGWFNYVDTFDYLVSNTPDGGTFVECGAWLGKSSSYLCSIAEAKNLKIYIVDSWKGSPTRLATTHKLATETDIFEIFKSNLEGANYTAIRDLSVNACKKFEDNSCDVVFIDMDHEYESVNKDIDLWFPKVKKNGIIAGHDYSGGWPGVIRAVDEHFGKSNITKMGQCWIYKKEA